MLKNQRRTVSVISHWHITFIFSETYESRDFENGVLQEFKHRFYFLI